VRVAILNNLRAGRSERQVSRILSLLRDYPEVLHVETSDTGALTEAFIELAKNRVDLLFVNGGDGTLQHALTEILERNAFERPPLIAPLRGGRTNMTALDLGTQRDPVRALSDVLAAIKTGTLDQRLVKRPILRVESRTRGLVQYGMFFGAGVIPRAISLTHRVFPSGKSQGAFGAGVVTALLLARAAFAEKDGIIRPDKIQALVDGQAHPHAEFTVMMASSLQHLYLKLNPFWGEGSGDVRFTTVASSAKHLARSVPGILRGRPRTDVTPENGYLSVNAENVSLRFDCGFTVDGEIFPEQLDEYAEIRADRRITFVRA